MSHCHCHIQCVRVKKHTVTRWQCVAVSHIKPTSIPLFVTVHYVIDICGRKHVGLVLYKRCWNLATFAQEKKPQTAEIFSQVVQLITTYRTYINTLSVYIYMGRDSQRESRPSKSFLQRSEGLDHAEGRPHASCLRSVESYLPGRWPDGGRRSTVATWTRRRAAPAYAPHTCPDLAALQKI